MDSRFIVALLLVASFLLAGCASEPEPTNVEPGASSSSSSEPVESGPASLGDHLGFSKSVTISGTAPRASSICGGPLGDCQQPITLDLTQELPGPGIYELTFSLEEFQVVFSPAMDGAIVLAFDQVRTNGQTNVSMRWIQPAESTAGLGAIAFNNLANPESLNPSVDFRGEGRIVHLNQLPVGSSFLLKASPGDAVNFTTVPDAVLDFNLIDPAGTDTEELRLEAGTVRIPESGELLVIGVTAPILEVDAGEIQYVPLRFAVGPVSAIEGGHRSETGIQGAPVYVRVWFTTDDEPVSYNQGYSIRVSAEGSMLASVESQCIVCQLTVGGAGRFMPLQSGVFHPPTTSVVLEVTGEGTVGVNAHLEVYYFEL